MKKEITIEDVKHFNARVDIMRQFKATVIKTIGFIKDSTNSQSRLKHSFFDEDLRAKLAGTDVPINLSTKQNKKKTLININGHIFFVDPEVHIRGLNQHVANPNLFLTFGPYTLHAKLAQAIAKNSSTIVSDMERPVEFQSQENIQTTMGWHHLSSIIERIKNLTAKVNIKADEEIISEEVTILVLDDKDKTQNKNVSIYEEYWIRDKNYSDETNIELYRATNINALYYIHAKDGHIPFTRKGIEQLYQIYESTLGSNKPLLIHDDHGQDYACRIAFAFELLRNYQDVFQSDDSTHTEAEKLVTLIFERLRESRSPVALANTKDLERAIELAFALRAVQLESQCLAQLEDFSKTIDAVRCENRFKKIEEIIQNVRAQKTAGGRKDYIESIMDQSLPDANKTLGFFEEMSAKIQRKREADCYKKLLKALRLAICVRKEVELVVLPRTEGKPALEEGRKVENGVHKNGKEPIEEKEQAAEPKEENEQITLTMV